MKQGGKTKMVMIELLDFDYISDCDSWIELSSLHIAMESDLAKDWVWCVYAISLDC